LSPTPDKLIKNMMMEMKNDTSDTIALQPNPQTPTEEHAVDPSLSPHRELNKLLFRMTHWERHLRMMCTFSRNESIWKRLVLLNNNGRYSIIWIDSISIGRNNLYVN
jgi:hypothetical protein